MIDLDIERENHALVGVSDYGWDGDDAVSARFHRDMPVLARRIAEDGPCALTRFDYDLPASEGGTVVEAGVVRFTLPDRVIERSPNEVGAYEWPDLDPSTVRPGDEVTISVEGSADIPAFGVVMVVPPAIDVAWPPPASDGLWHVRAGDPISVDWAPPPEPATVRLSIQRAVGKVDHVVACEVPADLGGLEVPARLLDQLPRGRAAASALRRTYFSETIDGVRIEVIVGGHLRLPDEDRPAYFSDVRLE